MSDKRFLALIDQLRAVPSGTPEYMRVALALQWVLEQAGDPAVDAFEAYCANSRRLAGQKIDPYPYSEPMHSEQAEQDARLRYDVGWKD